MDPGYQQNGIRLVDESFLATVPGFGVAQAVPASVKARMVFGYVRVAPTALNEARIDVNTSPGGLVQAISVPAGSGTARRLPFAFMVPGGTEYTFEDQGLAGVTEAIDAYSYVDLY